MKAVVAAFNHYEPSDHLRIDFFEALTLTLPSVLAWPLQVGSGLDTAVLRRLVPPSANLTTRGCEDAGGPVSCAAPGARGRLLKMEMICSHFSLLSILPQHSVILLTKCPLGNTHKLHDQRMTPVIYI